MTSYIAYYIAYYRVSTDRQGRSGLGLEAQQQAVAEYVQRTGGSLIEDYTEIESGKCHQRRQLAAAMAAIVEVIKAAGHRTVRAITDELNRRAIPTARPGARWQLANTHALLKRIERQNLGVLKPH